MTYKESDITGTRLIKSSKAKDLELSVNKIIEYAINIKDNNSFGNIIDSDIEWVDFDDEYVMSSRTYHISEDVKQTDMYDGCNIAYVVTHNKVAKCWIRRTTDVLDSIWLEEFLKCRKDKKRGQTRNKPATSAFTPATHDNRTGTSPLST